jgi:hypothetical protein
MLGSRTLGGLTRRARRNNRDGPVEQQLFPDGIGVVTFISEHLARPIYWHGEKVRNSAVVGNFATCEDKAEWATLPVCTGMNLCCKAAA